MINNIRYYIWIYIRELLSMIKENLYKYIVLGIKGKKIINKEENYGVPNIYYKNNEN